MKRLCEYHDQMLAIMAEGGHLIQDFHVRPQLDLLNARRRMMAQVMTSYQMFVHRELLDPLLLTGSAEEIECIRSIKAECVALVDEFCRFVRRWEDKNVLREWETYRAAAYRMMQRIKEHIVAVQRIAEVCNDSKEHNRPDAASEQSMRHF